MKVFITRKIKSNSPLNNVSGEIEGHSLLSFNPIEFNAVPPSDWIFFYSSNGVRYFAQRLKALGIEISSKIGVMGQGTASVFVSMFGRVPDFVGDGLKHSAIEFFNKEEGTILFVKGSNSLESVERYIDPQRTGELVVYTNEINSSAIIPDADIYVITSPMNAEAYMNVACCRFNTKIIAIGPTTNDKLIEKGFLLASMPDTPSEESIVTLINSMSHA